MMHSEELVRRQRFEAPCKAFLDNEKPLRNVVVVVGEKEECGQDDALCDILM